MQLASPNLSDSPQASNSPSTTYKRPVIRRHNLRHRRRRPPPSPTPSTTSPHSSTPNNITENQFNSSYSSPINSTSSSSHSSPPIFLSAVVPLPIFRGVSGECPVSHLTLFNRLFPSTNTSSLDQISRNFAITLLDNAALWYELTVEPHVMSWDETKSAFLRAFRLPEFAETARAELVSLRQGDGESVNSYHLRMQWILKRWMDHGLPESLVRGLFVDGLREEFHDWVMMKKPETVEEAVGIAMDWEAARAGRRGGEARCGFCEGRHGEKECEGRKRMKEEWMRRRMREEEEENVVGEEKKMGRVVSIGSMGRRSQCQCWKHQCWKKYERSASAVTVRAADGGNAAAGEVATATTATVAAAAAGPVGGISSAERIGGSIIAVGVFFLNLLFLCLQY